jgi:Asp-tRNA(Asn)/Glu-tRNA(Gln) amidotransferase A subunit family amidase
MNAIVIEHVPVAELPAAWRARLDQAGNARVTVRIEAEDDAANAQDAAAPTENPLFGMWSDHKDMADVAGYIRDIRAPRFGSGGTGGNGN